MANHDGKFIFVFTGPDGSGRKSVADAVGLTLGVQKIISYTTRGKRPIEEDGQDYYFVDEASFRSAAAAGEFVEHLTIHGYRYGIKEADITRGFEKGSVYVIMNRHGADILKQKYGDHVIRIFLYADRNTVRERQVRDGLSEPEIERHLSHYDEDMAYGPQCEHSVENINDLGHTVYHVTNVLEEYLQRDLVDKD
ncbi:guanylate kinase [Paenibacillus sp.]|uniref:guanylate kinase n=1 Tax=Paenibacillus sp. TaxID=58172 RepID=UPI002D249CD9|nr:guanylate kinase [Paenibacillus sp.]HZG87170.1 guanylate kinase [Paenibacillus sp.]